MTKCLFAIHWLFIAIGFLLAPDTTAQEPAVWKFVDGQQLRYEVAKTAALSLPKGGTKFNLKQQIELVWTVQSVDENGLAEIEQSIERIQLSLDDSLGKLEYDSAKDEDPGGVAALAGQLFHTLRAHPLRFNLAPNGKISDFAVPEEVLESMRNSSFESPLTEFTSEAGIRGLLLQGIPEFPADAVSAGDTWSETSETIGPIAIELIYQYQGKDDASLSRFTSTRKFSIADSAVNEDNAEANEQANIVDQNNSGEILFDAARGVLVQNQWTFKLRLNIPGGDDLVEGTIDQSFEMELVTESLN